MEVSEGNVQRCQQVCKSFHEGMFWVYKPHVADCTQFEKHTVSVPHRTPQGRDVTVTCDIYCRNISHWLKDLMGDRDLRHSWEWHAFVQTLHKDGDVGQGETLVTSPMSGIDAWKVEVSTSFSLQH
jgi:hypothetical protein